MSEDRFFSIVIPTRNRTDTLKYTIETCLNSKRFEDYEIVVNDNGDDDVTQDYIAGLVSSNSAAETKISYYRRSVVCSMSENFEEAVGRSTGEYVIVMGDDDGILPMALYELHSLINSEKPKIVKWQNGMYNWPGMMLKDAANYLGFSLVRSKSSKSTRSELESALDSLDYNQLPMLYINSAISRDIISTMRDGDGRLFRSPSPDIYSAMVLGHRSRDFLSVTVPFTLAGLSRHSNGVSSAFDGSNAAPKQDFSALNARGGIHHHERVPNLSVFPAVAIADSFYHAKNYHFPSDDTIDLPRRRLMQACVARADTTIEAVREELLRVCADDPDLAEFTRDLIANKTESLPPVRLKPALLGFDGENLHLDPRDYGVTTIADAVALVHRIIWPADEPLRYDLPGPAEMRANFKAMSEDLRQTRGVLADRSETLAETLGDVAAIRTTLERRSADLATTLADLETRSADLATALSELQTLRADIATATEELHMLRPALVERSADLEATLDDVRAVREVLIERTVMLEGVIAECGELRMRLAARG